MSASDVTAWDEFVARHSGGTVFHSMRWQGILARTYARRHHHVAALKDGSIRGLVSLYSARDLSGRLNLFSLPYTAYGGMLCDGKEAAQALRDRALEIADREGARTVYLRNTVDPGLGLPDTGLHVQFSKALPGSEQECLESIPRKSRATVRKSISNHGLEYEISRDWPLLWELHAVNLLKLGTPVFPKEYFRNIMEGMGEDADILFVKYKGKAVCGVMTFYFKDVCNPYFSGSLSDYNFTGCNNYMYYALMCHALKRECKVFDFGKSRKGSGSFDFKSNMGFEPRTLPFQILSKARAEASSLNPSNPKLGLFLRLWSMQPLWSSKLIGPVLNRLLP